MITKIEDIYPLTIVSMRYSGFAIVQALSTSVCINNLENDEITNEAPHQYMYNEWKDINYGIGKTIEKAFHDFQIRYK